MIHVENLTFAYRDVPVLRGVTFDLPEGGLTALLGCNGAGKTTLFRCMLGLLPGYKGSMQLDGKEMNTYTAHQLAKKIASIPQSHYPAFNYSVRDMVLMGTTQQTGLFTSPGKEQRRIAERKDSDAAKANGRTSEKLRLPMRVDHGMTMLGDESKGYNAGYSFLGRMFALGQVQGIMAAVDRELGIEFTQPGFFG